MDTDALAQQFWDNGYLLIEDFFEMELMDRLDKIILSHYGDSPDFWHNEEFLNKSKVEVVPWFPQEEGVKDFDEVEKHPILNELTQKILGEGWDNRYSMVMFSKQGTKGQSWHQDCSPENPKQFNINRLVYSSDITAEIGGQTVFVPGSHLQGEIPVGEPDADMPGQKAIEIKKGSLLILHGHTWHRVLPVKGKYRVSTNFRAAPKGTPEDITDVCVYRNMRYCFATNSVIEERV